MELPMEPRSVWGVCVCVCAEMGGGDARKTPPLGPSVELPIWGHETYEGCDEMVEEEVG